MRTRQRRRRHPWRKPADRPLRCSWAMTHAETKRALTRCNDFVYPQPQSNVLNLVRARPNRRQHHHPLMKPLPQTLAAGALVLAIVNAVYAEEKSPPTAGGTN